MQKIYGIHTVITLLNTHPQLIESLYLQQNREDQRIQMISSIANNQGIPLKMLKRSDLDALLPTGKGKDQGKGICHQGVIADVISFPQYSENDLNLFFKIKKVLLLILDGVQDPHNLGACLRSADALGVHAVIAPKDRAVGLTPTVRKVACGAAEVMPFITVTNLARTLKKLKAEGIWLVGTASEADTLITEIDLVGPIALVMGAEGKGLRRLTKENCDYLAQIPMRGSVISSFNISVAAGICLYEINRQRFFSG